MSPEVFDNQPPARCPKCGHEYGFLYSTPEYRINEASEEEELLWRCQFCRFVIITPTADTEEGSK